MEASKALPRAAAKSGRANAAKPTAVTRMHSRLSRASSRVWCSDATSRPRQACPYMFSVMLAGGKSAMGNHTVAMGVGRSGRSNLMWRVLVPLATCFLPRNHTSSVTRCRVKWGRSLAEARRESRACRSSCLQTLPAPWSRRCSPAEARWCLCKLRPTERPRSFPHCPLLARLQGQAGVQPLRAQWASNAIPMLAPRPGWRSQVVFSCGIE